ncbi:WecB/TagA/CpsF family glycosyltransferase [Desulfoscipio gibsoniae]|uniref:Exopolysaccharide biosynthesis protein, WecB/TagA/CpsF family n=1 Tax=Desulfoscipio gibsoniae DSM 7213 TaxID=767817 RepID=R4KWC9_9FIRM|nr:WecB/TagA/CpsF family glycosyltransferase [Desulfoscipio gibsoniae]AGL03926.1 exopolysaccharide biosynthesis protein, WecB/TagA/CpsF family [Desulfoscipio gibsoniae DSM 7213]
MKQVEEPPVCSLLGIKVHGLTMTELHALIKNAVDNQRQYIIGHHNLHSLYIYHHEPEMRDFYREADYIHVDGMSLVLLAQLLGLPLQRKHRVTYVDWVRPLMNEAARQGWRIFFLGSRPGVAANAALILREETPGLQLKTMHGYFDADVQSSANREVLQYINTYNPHILMIGMGMPRQERWVLNNAHAINANVILTAGACMDYVANALPTPPRWMGQLGLEWLFRLFSEPRRLWRRYLLEPWFILKLLMREVLKK